jgi:hypothetical protein
MSQTDVAKRMFERFKSYGYKPFQAIAFVGDSEGEDGLLDPPTRGDHDEACGPFQIHWHGKNGKPGRGELILQKTGIDIRNATIEQHCDAAEWELSNVMPKIKQRIQASISTQAAVVILVSEYERPKNIAGGIAKRTNYALTRAAELGVPTS